MFSTSPKVFQRLNTKQCFNVYCVNCIRFSLERVLMGSHCWWLWGRDDAPYWYCQNSIAKSSYFVSNPGLFFLLYLCFILSVNVTCSYNLLILCKSVMFLHCLPMIRNKRVYYRWWELFRVLMVSEVDSLSLNYRFSKCNVYLYIWLNLWRNVHFLIIILWTSASLYYTFWLNFPWPTSLLGFYRGVVPGVTGSLATGATYFGVIESTKKWIEETHPNLGGHWAHFIAGALGKSLFLYSFPTCRWYFVYSANVVDLLHVPFIESWPFLL